MACTPDAGVQYFAVQGRGVRRFVVERFIPHQASGVKLRKVFTRRGAFAPGELILPAGSGGGMAARFALLQW
ncbi:hypothetical protein ACIP10_33740 [Streptomyces galbus]|uniref:hypothetical protein n=1 Tax=Streptomyces galbus TaxID=33898 RepID=UPI00378C6DEC